MKSWTKSSCRDWLIKLDTGLRIALWLLIFLLCASGAAPKKARNSQEHRNPSPPAPAHAFAGGSIARL